MFIRWHKRQRQPRSGKTDVHWGVALTEATRINGKPRQRHVAYLGSFTEQGIESVDQRCRFWDRVNTRLHALPNQLTNEERNRIIGEIAIKVPVPTTAEHAQDDSDRANREMDNLLCSLLTDPSAEDNDLLRVVELFKEIKERHGVDKAKGMFEAVAAPSKRQRKLHEDKLLWRAYKGLPGSEKVGKAAELIHERFRKNGWPVFGASADATRKRLLREQRDLREKRDHAAQLINERHPEFGSPEVIQERLRRIESRLLRQRS